MFMMLAPRLLLPIGILAVVGVVNSFIVVSLNHRAPSLQRWHSQKMTFSDVSSIAMAVDVFDGSTIVDPVVVSDVFWASLRAKILTVVIGQLLATVAFAFLSSFLASQISQVGDAVSKTLFKESDQQREPGKKAFIKANEQPSDRAPDFSKLLVCLTIDVLGSSSELLPVLGELTDVIYAPIAATILRNLYGSNVLFGLEFVEEILPFTDILPLATICWLIDTYSPESDIAKLLQLGIYSPRSWVEDTIDTTADSSRPKLPGGKSDDR